MLGALLECCGSRCLPNGTATKLAFRVQQGARTIQVRAVDPPCDAPTWQTDVL